MTAEIIDGKAAAARLRTQIAEEVAALARQHVKPGLAVVLVGEDPASQIYVRSKGKQTKEVGMNSFAHHLPSTVSQIELLALIRTLNLDTAVDGILVQLPLPAHIDADLVLRAIDPSKDVDGFHPLNAGLIATGAAGVAPCTPLGCLQLIKSVRQDLSGLHAVVVGRSNIVGKPMGQLLLREDCTATICHRFSRDVPAITRTGDILVVAVGRPELVRRDWIKPGAIVIDVGINRLSKPDGATTLVGDVHFEDARNIAAAVTPVPGGVGPMTIACLLRNTLDAARGRLDRNTSIPQ